MNEPEETDDRLLPCPFCGGSETTIDERSQWNGGIRPSTLISVEIRHWCDDTLGDKLQSSMLVKAKTREVAIAKWNSRASEVAE